MKKYCSQCGAALEAEDRFCYRCGSKAAFPGETPERESAEAAPMSVTEETPVAVIAPEPEAEPLVTPTAESIPVRPRGKQGNSSALAIVILAVIVVVALAFVGVLLYRDGIRGGRADALFAESNYTEALAAYEEALLRSPRNREELEGKRALCLYEIANGHYAAGEWQEALDIYRSLGDYEDAAAKAEECSVELEKRDKADDDFLEALAAAVLARNQNSSQEKRAETVKAELKSLEKFAHESFFDKELGQLAKDYVQALKIQRDAVARENVVYQVKWREGEVKRYEVLKDLYTDYGFMKDDDRFKQVYITNYTDVSRDYIAYKTAREAVEEQMSSSGWYRSSDDQTVYCEMKNNTRYAFKLTVIISFLDQNGVRFENATCTTGRVRPGDAFEISVPAPDGDRAKRVVPDFYFEYVDY